MLSNDVHDGLGKLQLPGLLDPDAHVALDHRRREAGLHLVMPVVRFLVLDEVVRLVHLPDVVVVRAHPRKEGVRPYCLAGGLREVRDADGVRVGARAPAKASS